MKKETKGARQKLVANKKELKEHTHPKNDSMGTTKLRKLYKNAMKGSLPM